MSTWVLLRGLAREARHWGDFPAALQERTGASRVLTLDLPGSGVRAAERSPATVEAMVTECRQALERTGSPGPCVLFALSLGAMVATSWATHFADEVRGMVLVNTSMRGFGSWQKRLRPGNYARMLRLLCSSDAERIEREILGMTSRHPSIPPAELLPRWAAWHRSHSITKANVLRQLRAAASFQAPEAAPRMPLLVLASRRDGLVNPSCSVRMAHAWHARLALHPTAGHDLPLDDPQWVLMETQSWFERELQAARPTGASTAPGG